LNFREFSATPEAVTRARALGVYGETAKRLARAARRSATFTSDLGNRRFLDLVLTVHGKQVVWVNRLDAQAA
jgi:hypothetical protein